MWKTYKEETGNHGASRSVDHSFKTLERRKEARGEKAEQYVFSSGRMHKNPDYLGIISWYTFVALILNITKHFLI